MTTETVFPAFAAPLMGFHQPRDIRRDRGRARLDHAMIRADDRLGRRRLAGGIIAKQADAIIQPVPARDKFRQNILPGRDCLATG